MRLTQQIIFMIWVPTVLMGCAGDEDSTGHVHHEFPQHRPGNLQEAVASVAHRSHDLAHHGGQRNTREFSEFVDVIRWIPEMAADSDLKQAQWETARQAAERIENLVLADRFEMSKLENAIGDDLKILRDLVPKAGTPEPDLHHDDHDHSHDHHEHHDHRDAD